MRILITNNTLGHMPGGSEWHAHELALAIKNKGHDVEAYTPTAGWFAHSLNNKGVKVYEYPPERDYDLIIASHLSTINNIDRNKTRGKMIQVCHGKFPVLEQPSKKVDGHVSISEEVQDHLRESGFDSVVIYNGVDHKKFFDSGEGEGVLSLCQGHLANSVIKKACSTLNVNLTQMNKFKKYSYNLHQEIPKHHTVISLGRGAFEAMACNKSLIVADSRHYVSGSTVKCDGLVSNENAHELMKNNCSGRRYGDDLSVDDMVTLIAKSLSSENPNLRQFSESELNIDTQAVKYLNLL